MKTYRIIYSMDNHQASRHSHEGARKISDNGHSSTFELAGGLTEQEAHAEIERIAKQWLSGMKASSFQFANWGFFCANLNKKRLGASAGTFSDGGRWFSHGPFCYETSEENVPQTREKGFFYSVTTSSCEGQHDLHHLNPVYHKETESFASESLEEARRVYEKEVAWLKSEARPADWDFVEQEPHSAVYCELRKIEEESGVDEFLENSEYFYIPD